MNKLTRKVIVWGLLIVLALPNIVVGEPSYKIFGVVLAGVLIWWDVVASKKETGEI